MYSFSATHAAARRAKAWRREGGEGKGVKVGQSREVGDGIGQPKGSACAYLDGGLAINGGRAVGDRFVESVQLEIHQGPVGKEHRFSVASR